MDPFKFEIMTRRPAGALDKVLSALDLAQKLPLQSVKLNVVVLKGLNDSPEELRAFAEYTRDRNVVVRFIEVRILHLTSPDLVWNKVITWLTWTLA